MKQILAILVLFVAAKSLQAQDSVMTDMDTAMTNQVVFVGDDRIADMYDLYLEENAKAPVVQGYRIQLASGQDRNNVNAAKTKFYSKFPGMRPYIVYQQPNFKLRVGGYRTKIEAQKVLLEIQEEFHDAFLIRDDIPSKDL